MTEPIQTDLDGHLFRKYDVGTALLCGLAIWLFCIGMDRLGEFMFKVQNPTTAASMVGTLSIVGSMSGFNVWKKLDSTGKYRVIVAVIVSFIAMVVTTIPRPANTLLGFALCVPAIAAVVYEIRPVFRLVRELEKLEPEQKAD